MKTIEVKVESSGENYSAYIEGLPIMTVGDNMEEIKSNMQEAIDLYLQDNPNVDEMFFGEYELVFKPVVQSPKSSQSSISAPIYSV
ncbi:MAG: hypothetical protein IKN99_07070 [Bacteroidales bacterium]|jgi:predicted RNase H-like HicB family nuclease|nr:hypothetical protein [Bacteroidales bacterium]MBR3572998.1 hypothetical protein [Bacteroidales bacterium]